MSASKDVSLRPLIPLRRDELAAGEGIVAADFGSLNHEAETWTEQTYFLR